MKQTPRELLDAAARTRVPDSLSLYPRMAARLERKTLMQTMRAKPGLLILFVVLALTLMTGVAYAVGRLTGFIPGFGFTGDTSAVYLLREPVQIERDGITLRVENAVSAEDKFRVSLAVDGKVESDLPLYPGITVVLSDGTQIPYQAGQEDDQDARPRQESYEFPALPAGTTALTLRYEYFTIDGTPVWSVEVPVVLRPLRANEVIPAPEISAASLQSDTHDGLTLVLDNVATASDKTILQVSLRFDEPGVTLNANWNVTLIGEDGKIYPLTEVMSASNNQSKTYETRPFRGDENLMLNLVAFPNAEALPMSVDVPIGEATFTFDPGVEPQVGQNWTMDEQIQAGKYLIHLIGVKQVSPTELRFEFAPTPGVTGIRLYSPLVSGGTGSLPVENASYSASLFFEKLPAQPIIVSVTGVGYIARGQWQIRWQASAAPQGVLVGPTNTAAPTGATFSTPTIASSDPLLLEVQALAQKFDSPFQQGAGWVHILTESETYPRPGQTFPPPSITSEKWLELDADGYVIRTILTDRDKAGNLIQQAVSIGNYSINLTTGESGYNENARYLFSTDLLTGDLITAAEQQMQITSEEAACDDGSRCLLVTLFDAFDQPVQHTDEPQPILGMGRKTWVNLNTGQQVKVQAFSRLQDGNDKVEYTDRTLLVEKAGSPPEEVLTIINGVVPP